MTYKMSLKSSPRLIILITIIVLLAAGGITAAILIPTRLWGLVILGVILYINYNLIKFITGQMKSRVTIYEESIFFLTPLKEKIEFKYSDITHAGVLQYPDNSECLYIYNGNDDQVISIPSFTYHNYEDLKARIQNKVEFNEMEAEPHFTPQDYLRTVISVPGENDGEETDELSSDTIEGNKNGDSE